METTEKALITGYWKNHTTSLSLLSDNEKEGGEAVSDSNYYLNREGTI